jgi:uncharacterized membrane protein HdeD (DUF308 family)
VSNLGAASSADERRAADAISAAASLWWIFLILGCAWLLFSIVVFRFDWTTVSAISILFGIVMLAAGLEELFAAFGAGRGVGWSIARGLLGLAFVVIGIVAFVHPGGTFKALAAVISFYFILKGAFTIVLALMSHGEELWWLILVVGLAELLLGFWAAGDFGHRQALLVVWIGAAALARGLTQILYAFRLRGLKHAAAGA